YIPIDISRDQLIETADDIATHYPHIHVTAICADYSKPLELPPPSIEDEGGRLGFFPGSTIGNLSPEGASDFLKQVGAILGSGAGFMVGVDTKKDPAIIEAAYNDEQGVTARFNLNILERINRELGGNFNVRQFEHMAFYNEDEGRLEMHLASKADQNVRVLDQEFQFAEGETIHTENSYKYTVHEFQQLVRDTGLEPLAVWEDREGLFSVHYLRIK
ncbi:MAG: L-histidine N(alpha)-methyltransferase, partial [Kangiella sp.]|nr:L-histidine N(alpha)-methyltransferase [Kangiella sp.]